MHGQHRHNKSPLQKQLTVAKCLNRFTDLFMINLACRFCFISSTLFMASTVEIKKDFRSEVN